jgi:cytochrome P450
VRFDQETDTWLVEDPDLVRTVLLNPDTFRPDNALIAHRPLSVRALRILATAGFALPPTLANNGTPTHRPIRHAVSRFFTPGRVRAAEPLVRRLVLTRVAEARRRLVDGEEVDLVATIARDVPALVLLDLLGVADVDVAALKRWSIDSLELFWGWPTAAEQQRLATSAAEFYAWLRRRIAEVRESPAHDLLGQLVDLGLSDVEICGAAYFVLIAGQETTSQLISTAFHRLIGDSVRWRSLGEAPELAGPVLEEVLAQSSPVPTWRRMTAGDVMLGQTYVPAGAPLLLTLTGSSGASDLVFGLGVHRCVGAALARMEAKVAVEETARALPYLRLVETHPPMIDVLSFRAPRRVLVEQSAA